MGRVGRHDIMLMYYLLYTAVVHSRERERGRFVDRGAAATLVINYKTLKLFPQWLSRVAGAGQANSAVEGSSWVLWRPREVQLSICRVG